MTGDHIDVAGAGESVELPLVDILTGRGFVTGKSGSGKSNSVNVTVEELLDRNQPLLIVDTDGEYWGLKEQYQILHLGNGEQCDVRVTSTDAETIVDLALVERVPIILDISGFIHKEDAQEIVHRVVRELFHREKTLKQPFLLIVEEVHEYIPETGGLSDMGKMLIQVAKRGRKHGLGFLGVSQRPASVDKDFITQCDWIVWHRLTWKNDTDVVSTILGNDAADTVEDLDPGEALLMTDWDEQVRNVQVRQKRTFDAGATPGFEDFEPPDLIPVNPAILNRFDERRQNVDYGTAATEEDGEDADDADAETTRSGAADETASGESADADRPAEDADGSSDDADEPDIPLAETTPIEDADDPSLDSSEPPTDTAAEGQEAPAPADPNVLAAETDEPGAEGSTEAEASADADGTTDAPPTPAEPANRPPLGEEPLEAEIVSREPDATAPTPRNGPNGGARRGRGGQAPTHPPNTSQGIAVEFAELLLFLGSWVRSALEGALLRVAGALGSVTGWVASALGRTRTRTHLADEDVVVAMWLSLLVAFILLLAVVLVVAL
jgi:hypothetical protein